MSLQSIGKEDYLDFANRWLKDESRKIDGSTFDYIYVLSKGITFYIQAILHGIYEHYDETINKALVDQVVNEQIEEQATSYQNYLSWLTENQQLLLRSIASEGNVGSPLSQSFIRSHNLPAPSSVKTALNALADKQLISRSPQDYTVSDLFFAKWLNDNKF